MYSFAPTETKDNISQSLEKITSSISSAKDNISTSIPTNIVSLNQETSIADINKNTTNYLNKSVIVRGALAFNLAGSNFLQDEQGYNLLIECGEAGRTLSYGSTYIAKGTIKERAKPFQTGGGCYPQTSFDNGTIRTVVECTPIETEPYLQCTEPMKKV